jgi:hypothetical protein
LGLQDYLLTQGLARKVLDAQPKATKDTIQLPGEGWFDVIRSRQLWQHFAAPASIIRRGDWVDKPSVNIPALYVMQGYFLSDALAQTGDARDAGLVASTTSAIAHAAHLDELFRPPAPAQPSEALPLPESGDRPLPRPVPQRQTPQTK